MTAILQDRDGFMWFGTGDGLNKYDGTSFTVFKPDSRQPAQSFQNGYIMGLCEGATDQLWVVTDGGGLHEVNRKTGRVIPHPIRAAHANRWNTQLSVYQDRQHILWISTQAGLARYDPGRHHFRLYPSPVADVAVKTVFEDHQHRFWVATHQGLYHFNRSTGQYTRIPIQGQTGTHPSFQAFYLDLANVLWLGTATAGYSLLKLDLRTQPWTLVPYNPGGKLNPFVWRNTLHRDSSGIIWMGTTQGLQGINPATNQVFTYQSYPNQFKGLASSSVQAVYHDRSGMLWVGTDNGIDRQAATTRPFAIYQVKPNERRASMPENRVFAVFKDFYGQLWFNNSPTLYRLSADHRQLDRIPPQILGNIDRPVNEATAFLPDGPNGLWIGSYQGLYHYNQATGRFTAYPSSIPAQFIATHYQKHGPTSEIWIGGDGGFASFNPHTHQYTYYPHLIESPTGIPDKFIYGLLVNRSGELWLLIHRLGLCHLNPKTGQITRYTAGSEGTLSSNDVRSIYEDRDGIIWIGTHRGGLNRFDPETGRFTAITHQDGIAGNSILGITGDQSGNLWLSTNEGLCRVTPSTKAIRNYTVADGLPSNNFKQNAVCRQGNQLIFGSDNGIVQFIPDQIRDALRHFPVYITQLKVMDQTRMLTDTVVQLKHDENLVSIGFAALVYEQPRQNQYAYKLVGINPDWVHNGNRTVATFNSLPPGTYQFRVKAADSHGVWSKQVATLQLLIQPPWWANRWAYGFYILIIIGMIWGFMRFSTHRIRQQQELELNRRQAEQLKAVDELKTRFFSNITHEFRTPLSLILAPIEKLLQEERFDGPMLTQVHRNARRLLGLINQLLDLAKLEGHYMAVIPVRGRVPDFIDQLVVGFQRAAEQKEITFLYDKIELPDQEHIFDADKWEKILTNLLANALKFTSAGGRVSLTVKPIWNKDVMTDVLFQLADSGVGIEPRFLPHIFNRFFQADTSTTRTHAGTGLGLALVYELIQLLEGHISVQSQPGVGSVFTWRLPVQSALTTSNLPLNNELFSSLATAELPLETLQAPPTLNLQQPRPIPGRILIVEDNQELREFLAGELASSYHVLQASDGREGWEIARAEVPDIVLTDVMMPRLDGHALCQLIKGHPETDHIAVVMLTAKAAEPSRIQGLQYGADEYLSKPFSSKELQLRLQNLISRQHKLAEHYRQQFSIPAASTNPKLGLLEENPNPFLVRIYTLLEQHLDDPTISVDWLADQLAMNRKTLYRKLQSLIQLAPADLIRHYRIRKATEFLRAGYTVAETADRVGFNTPSYFTMVFKEICQQTPTQFIAAIQA